MQKPMITPEAARTIVTRAEEFADQIAADIAELEIVISEAYHDRDASRLFVYEQELFRLEAHLAEVTSEIELASEFLDKED